MATRSRIPVRFLAREVARAFRSDAKTSQTLAAYQIAKETFNLRSRKRTRAGVGREVRMINLRITDMCNLRCHTCGQWGDNGYLRGKSLVTLKSRELTLDVYRRFVDDVADAGWSPIWYIWGGEPMMYPGLLDLIEHIHGRGMLVALVTNGFKVAKNAERLLNACKIIYLSVDGHNAGVHNAQRPGANPKYDNFSDVRAGLETLRALKRERDLVYPYLVPLTCITKRNVGSLVDIYESTRGHADAHVFYLCWWIDQVSADAHTRDFSRRFGFAPSSHYGWLGDWKDFDHPRVIEQMEAMRRHYASDPRCLPIMMPKLASGEEVETYYTNHEEDFGYNQCVSIFMEMQIDSNGDVSLCRDYHDYTIGNIANERIIELWNNERARRFRSSIASEGIMPVCRRCCGLMGY